MHDRNDRHCMIHTGASTYITTYLYIVGTLCLRRRDAPVFQVNYYYNYYYYYLSFYYIIAIMEGKSLLLS